MLVKYGICRREKYSSANAMSTRAVEREAGAIPLINAF